MKLKVKWTSLVYMPITFYKQQQNLRTHVAEQYNLYPTKKYYLSVQHQKSWQTGSQPWEILAW